VKDLGQRTKPAFAAALAIFAIASATIVGAWIFQAFGYAPCELCLKERIPYYIGIVAAALAVALASRETGKALSALFVVLLLVFVFSAGFGAYHAGVEWGFWPGPTDCTGSYQKATSAADFLRQLHSIKVVRCDAVAIRILGLSLAGWNAVISVVLAWLAVVGLRAKSRLA